MPAFLKRQYFLYGNGIQIADICIFVISLCHNSSSCYWLFSFFSAEAAFFLAAQFALLFSA